MSRFARHIRVVRGAELAADSRARARRLVTVGSTRDDVVALQTRLKDLALATSLAVEACKALTEAQLSQWADLAKRVLSFVSTDPGNINPTMRDQGLALAQELASWGDILRGAGCQAPIPAPPPLPPPPPNTNMWDFSQSPAGGFLDKLVGPVELLLLLALLRGVRDVLR